MNATPPPKMGSVTTAALAPPPPPLPPEIAVMCPFTVVVDTREQKPYAFSGLRANADQGNRPIMVPIAREALGVGDYSIQGMDSCVVERKSKEDLYSSVVKRDNFIGRLERMSEQCSFAAIVVECEWHDMLMNPPPRSKFSPKALARTVFAWSIRYPIVHWFFLPDRASAEAATFRILEQFHHAIHHGEHARNLQFDGTALRFPAPRSATTPGGKA